MTNKAFKVDWNQISESSLNPYCVSINRRQALAIISQLEYLRWRTRWLNAPSDDVLQAFVNDIEAALLGEDSECGAVVTCEQIVDCIDGSQTLRDKIISANRPSGNGTTPNAIQTNIINNVTNVFNTTFTAPDADDCDAVIFAAVRQMVTFIENLIIDALQFVEASVENNIVEFVGVLSNIIILDEIGIDAIVQFVQWIYDNLIDAFPAAATQERRDELACKIFCRLSGTCEISLGVFADVIDEEAAFVNPPISSVETFINWINNVLNVVVGANPDLAYIMGMQFMFGQLRFLDGIVQNTQFKTSAAVKLAAYLRSFMNDSDPDYAELCDCSDQWEYEFDFTVNNGGWLARQYCANDSLIGNYVSGVGWQTRGGIRHPANCNRVQTHWRIVHIYIPVVQGGTLLRLEIDANGLSGNGYTEVSVGFDTAITGEGSGMDYPLRRGLPLRQTFDVSHVEIVNREIDKPYLFARLWVQESSTNPTGFGTITRVKIAGRGTRPL